MIHQKPYSDRADFEQRRNQQINNQKTQRYAASGRAVSWPITIHSTTTDVIPAPTSSIRYVQTNNLIMLWFDLVIEAGSVGGDDWYFLMPAVSANAGGLGSGFRGGWKVIQFPTNYVAEGWVEVTAAGDAAFLMYRATVGLGVQSLVGSLAPFDWSVAGGCVSGFLTYEADSIYSL